MKTIVKDRLITMIANIKETKELHFKTVGYALTRIQSGKSRSIVEQVRQGNKDAKRELPVTFFSGTFNTRTDDGLFDHSGLVVLDFDKLLELDEVRSQVAVDQYTYAMWVSPSGNGIKVLVQIKFPERHRDHFRALTTYFQKQYGLEVDPSGINESRACFESYDPDLVLNENSQIFAAILTEKAENQVVKVSAVAQTDYRKLAIAARMIQMAADGDKHSTLRNAAVLCGGYIAVNRLEEDEVVRILLREIQKRDIDSIDTAMHTIRDGIEYGKHMPINETIEHEKSIVKEVDLEEMDMSFLSGDDEDFDWIDKYAEGKIKPGLSTGNEYLDKYFLYKRELVIFNGHSNVGKTTVVLFLIMNSVIRHNWKWLIYSAENKTALIKVRLMEFLVNRPIKSMTFQERKLAFKWVQEHFTIISNDEVYSYKDMILMCEKIRRSQQLDGFFVDPYNALKIKMSGNNGLSTHEYHYEAISEFLTYGQKNEMAMWVNMHAVTEAQRRKGDDNLPVAPYAEDTEGGGKMVNRCDTFVTIHRKIQSPEHHVRTTSELHVRKVRTQELGGEPTPWDEPFLLRLNSNKTGFNTLVGEDLCKPKVLTTKEEIQKTNLELSDIHPSFDINSF